jgi:hypothetical protein
VPGPDDAKQPDEAAPEPIGTAESAPVTSGGVPVAEPVEPVEYIEPGKSGRAKRVSQSIQNVVSGGVEKLGVGINAIGEGIAKVGEYTDKVPLVGTGVTKIGEGIAKAGVAMEQLPRVTQTRRGRLLVRSVVVAFLLIAAWIAAIVWFQVRENDTPDLRPDAERILVELSKGSADWVYDNEASPRFQEIERKEQFVGDMNDMVKTLGKFRELTAINGTVVTYGPTGRLSRVSLTASFDNGIAKGWIGFHDVDGTWKLIGIGIDLPPELKITKEQREKRVEACADKMSPKTCDLYRVADGILQQLRDGHADQVWEASDAIFKKSETKPSFIAIQDNHRRELGAYRRILDVTEARLLNNSASYELLAEYEKSSAVRTVFGFERASMTAPWMLHSLKIVLPMPRAEAEAPATAPAVPQAVPVDAGVRDASSRLGR